MSFQDQEKLLQEVVFNLAVSMNASTKNFQIKHYPYHSKLFIHIISEHYPKYAVVMKHKLHNLQTRKKHLKNGQELKFIFQNMLS